MIDWNPSPRRWLAPVKGSDILAAMTDRAAAFFDLDRTLLDMNSSTLWAMHELRQRRISVKQFGRVMVWNALYHLSLIDIETAYGVALAHYRGRFYEDLQEEARAWFLKDVAHHLRPGAERALRDHRAQGHPLVLLTSASSFAARAALDTWGMDHFLSNDFPTDDGGRLDGTFVAPLCYGPGKVERASSWAADHGVDLSRSYFYSDSYSDAPMLRAVGYPRVISPDPRLSREARQRGWPVLQW
jgi:HAD superfamily hydrolase (TIGR01490 family)